MYKEAVGDEGNDGNNYEKDDDTENSQSFSWQGEFAPFNLYVLVRSFVLLRSAMNVKVFVIWIDRDGHLQVTIRCAIWTYSFVNHACQSK